MSKALPADIGTRQRDIQDERLEYLRVALAKQYQVGPGHSSSLDRQSCRTISFPTRTDLCSIREFRPYFRPDPALLSSPATINGRPLIASTAGGAYESIIGLADVKMELDRLEADERYREGGLLYLVGHQNLFWTMMLVWHHSGTTGHKGWDFILNRTSQDPSNKQLVDCMFYCTPYGCHISNCPYLHSKPRKEACEQFTLQNAQKRMAAAVAKLDTLIEEAEEVDDIVAEELREEEEAAIIRRNQRKNTTASTSSSISQTSSKLSDDTDSDITVSPGSPIYKNKLARLSAASFAYESAQMVAEVSREQRQVYCHTCQKQEPVGQKYKLCSKCRSVRYCGRKCQEDDWKNGHSKVCQPKSRHGSISTK